jgi:hypothetical protein
VVLDYKLSHAPAELVAYREQMARYVRAVQALQPDDRVRAAFITGAGDVVELCTQPPAPRTAARFGRISTHREPLRRRPISGKTATATRWL